MLLLDQNLIKMHVYAEGVTNIPRRFHVWAFLTAIAAAVGDRVSYHKHEHSRLSPNLYTFLLGESGLGANIAMEAAVRYVRGLPQSSVYQGTPTAEAVMTHMSKTVDDENFGTVPEADLEGVPRRVDQFGALITERGVYNIPAKTLLVTPDISMSIRSSSVSGELIQFMGEMYSHGTVTHSSVPFSRYKRKILGPCPNWLASTTGAWLRDNVPVGAEQAGFYSTLFVISEKVDFKKQVYDPTYPEDALAIREQISERFMRLNHIEGPLKLNAEAKLVREDWLKARPRPVPGEDASAWLAEDDMALKLAMLFSLASGETLTISGDNMRDATSLASQSREAGLRERRAPADPSAVKLAKRLNFMLQQDQVITRCDLVARFSRSHSVQAIEEAVGYLLRLGDWKELTGPRRGKKYQFMKNSLL